MKRSRVIEALSEASSLLEEGATDEALEEIEDVVAQLRREENEAKAERRRKKRGNRKTLATVGARVRGPGGGSSR